METLAIKPMDVANIALENINNRELISQAISLLKLMEEKMGIRSQLEVVVRNLIRNNVNSERQSIAVFRQKLEKIMEDDKEVNGVRSRELMEIKSIFPEWAISVEKAKVPEAFLPTLEVKEQKPAKSKKPKIEEKVNDIIVEKPKKIVMESIAALKDALTYMDMIISNEPDESLTLDETTYRIKFQKIADLSEIVRSWGYRTKANDIMWFKTEINKIFETIIETIALYLNTNAIITDKKEFKSRTFARIKDKISEIEEKLIIIPENLKRPE